MCAEKEFLRWTRCCEWLTSIRVILFCRELDWCCEQVSCLCKTGSSNSSRRSACRDIPLAQVHSFVFAVYRHIRQQHKSSFYGHIGYEPFWLKFAMLSIVENPNECQMEIISNNAVITFAKLDRFDGFLLIFTVFVRGLRH